MSDYESIHGRRINFLSSDPTLTSSYEGQVWYNSATNRALVNIKAWSSSGPMTTARDQLGGAGTQTATVVFGGQTSPPTRVNSTEEYGGFTWFTGANLNETKSGVASAGTQTAALCSSGQTAPGTFTANVEEYNGSSWSEQNNLTTSGTRRGCGTQTAGLVFGGTQAPPVLDATEEYDGTNWTNGGSMNVARSQHTGCGIQTSALAISGGTSPSAGTGAVENYNGSSWTTVSSLNTTRYDMGSAAANADHALGFGGYVGPSSAVTEEWDGSSWTTAPATMGTARYNFAGSGTASQAVASGGVAGPRQSVTEEYNSNINTFTAASWASGGNIGTTRRNMAAGGITSAGIIAGGFVPPASNSTEEYNGTSWSEQNNIPVAKEVGGGGFGVQTAFVVSGGSGPDNIPNGYSQTTQEYDGTNWTAGGSLNVARLGGGGFCGTESAGLGFGGYVGASSPYAPPSKTLSTEEYNGSAWTTQNNVPTGPNTYFSASGTQTATVGVRQTENGGTVLYDGTNWTTGSGTLTVLKGIGSMAKNGTSTASVVFGGTAGNPPARTAATEEYNGTVFVNTANMATARGSIGGSGNNSNAFAAGGYTGTTNVNSTEEYTYQGASTATASTLTTS